MKSIYRALLLKVSLCWLSCKNRQNIHNFFVSLLRWLPSHLLIFSSSHLLIFSSSHLLIFSSSYLLIFLPSHLLPPPRPCGKHRHSPFLLLPCYLLLLSFILPSPESLITLTHFFSKRNSVSLYTFACLRSPSPHLLIFSPSNLLIFSYSYLLSSHLPTKPPSLPPQSPNLSVS